MTDEEKFRFDLAGFLVRPAILTADEIGAIRDQIYRIHHDPESLSPAERTAPGGAASILIDHPAVIDVLHEIIGPELRLEVAFSIWREAGSSHGAPIHGGGPGSIDPLFGYRIGGGRIYAGATRVVIELSEVRKTDGATSFILGSHKANFPVHPDHLSIEPGKESPFLVSYDCPPGSAVFFTEAIAHVGPPWRGTEPRVAVLSLYSHVATNYTRMRTPKAVIAGLDRRHQAYFRDVWLADFGAPGGTGKNTIDRFLESEEPPISPPEI